MNNRRNNTTNFGPNPQLIALHIVHAMSNRQGTQRRYSASELALELGVRRDDIDSVLSKLDAQDIVDVERMSLTLSGFTIGMALGAQDLQPLRPEVEKLRQAA
jgi:hypothetical protein